MSEVAPYGNSDRPSRLSLSLSLSLSRSLPLPSQALLHLPHDVDDLIDGAMVPPERHFSTGVPRS